MGNGQVVLTKSKSVTIFVPNTKEDDLLGEIENFQVKSRIMNRSKAIVELIRKGLERVKDAKK
jgi:metal-responsive CopG/Arc/MetJ family transcriptional regulator